MKLIRRLGRVSFLLLYLLYTVSPASAIAESDTQPGLQTNGKAVILMDAHSGRVLYERNSQKRLPPASLTKIMTGLLVAENGNLDKKVRVSRYAAETPECTVYLEPGEVLTRMELLYAAMLPSANDACNALAENIAGDEDTFLELMNQRAHELGLKNTRFQNAHGLETEGHYSTAYDLALLTKKALTYPVFAEVVGSKRAVIPWASREDEDRILLNQNRLLYRYEDAIGVKTGYTKQAGNCVVGAARRGDMVLIAVSLNSPTVYDDLKHMLDYGFDHYQMAILGKSDQVSGKVRVLKGEASTIQVKPADHIAVAATEEELPYLAYSLHLKPEITAPVYSGDVLGTCHVYLHGAIISSQDLTAAQTVGRKNSWTATVHSQTSAALNSKWLNRSLGLALFMVLFINRRHLENGLKRFLLFLLRNKIPPQHK